MAFGRHAMASISQITNPDMQFCSIVLFIVFLNSMMRYNASQWDHGMLKEIYPYFPIGYHSQTEKGKTLLE